MLNKKKRDVAFLPSIEEQMVWISFVHIIWRKKN